MDSDGTVAPCAGGAEDGVYGLDHVQVAIPEGTEAEARAFYGGALGLRELTKPETLQGRGGVWYALGAQALHLGVEREFQPARKAHPALLVRDLDAVRRRLAALGVAVREDVPLPGVARCFVFDPFGNRIELVQHLV